MLYTIYADGGARPNPGKGGCGVIIMQDNKIVEKLCLYLGEGITNNMAEYEGLILGLSAIQSYKPEHLQVFMDSKLVIKQVTGEWTVGKLWLKGLHSKALLLCQKIIGNTGSKIQFNHIPREYNRQADHLATLAITEMESFCIDLVSLLSCSLKSGRNDCGGGQLK